MCLRPLYIFYSFSAGIDFRRQNLFWIGPRTERFNSCSPGVDDANYTSVSVILFQLWSCIKYATSFFGRLWPKKIYGMNSPGTYVMSVKKNVSVNILVKKMTPTTKDNFFLLAAAAILFSMDASQKLFRSSELPREQPYQIWMQSNQRFISYRANKLLRRPSWKMAAFGLVQKN